MVKKQMFLVMCLCLMSVLASVAQAQLPAPVGWWTLDEGAGTTAVDNTGNGYDATLGGDAAWVTDAVHGGGVHFSGAGWIDLPPAVWNEKIVPNATYSFCFWYNLPDAGANKVGFGSTLVGGGRHFQSHLPWANGTIYFDTSGHRGNDQSWQADWTGEWAFWTFQHDNINGWKRYYRNDELIHDSTGQAATLPEATALVVGANGGHATGSIATYDDIRFYDLSLTVEEIQGIMAGEDFVTGPAVSPSPGNGQTDVIRDTVLTWGPGKFSAGHKVYFGDDFDDVNSATEASDAYKGEKALDDTSYDPGRMELGATHFWRIDEVNDAHPDKLWTGEVWSFEVEPVGIMVDQLTASASSQASPDEDPNNTINGVGLNEDGSHSKDKNSMWLSANSDPNTAWIRYDLPAPQKLVEMLVWNHNTQSEEDLGYGIKDALIEVSVDGNDFTSLGTVELAKAAETTVALQGIVAQSVKITAQSNWGGIFKKYGLSEVRLLAMPMAARELSPADGTANVDPTTAVLTWRAGREADVHNVYLSTDEQAVIDGTAPKVTLPEALYAADIALDTTNYWRVDEVNDLEDPAVWAGSVQSFSTTAYIVVDDMEFYKSEDGKWIWETWTDGFEIASNGALLGHGGDDMETLIVHEGSQSLPYNYGQGGAAVSEATLPIDAQDWSEYGIQSLSLYFHGTADNTGGQFYVKINNTKFDYQGGATDIQTAQWFPFTIDLTGVTVVNSLTIGVAGGSGTFYVDNIRLYAQASELITPVAPDAANLQMSYLFEGNFNDSSGKGRNGTALGAAAIIADPARGQVLSLDGIDSAVAVPLVSVADETTIAMWLNVVDLTIQYNSAFSSNGWEPNCVHTRIRLNSVDMGFNGPGNTAGITDIAANEWIHVAYTVKNTATETVCMVWLNGIADGSTTTAVDPEVGPRTVWIGNGTLGAWLNASAVLQRFLNGMIDDVVIYDRALSAGEIAALAGRTAPLYKPF